MVKKSRSLEFKLFVSLVVSLVILVSLFTYIQIKEVRQQVEENLTAKGMALAKSAAQGLSAKIESDIKAGFISEETLFDRSYTLLEDNTDPKQKKYSAAFDKYTDEHWQTFVDSFLADEDVVFAIPVAYSGEDATEGYLPTHNTKYADRTKRIFNDSTGTKAVRTTVPLKTVYQRDTGETMWDISAPIMVNGKHWGGYRVAISIVNAEKYIAEMRTNIIILMLGFSLILIAVVFLVSHFIIGRPVRMILGATVDLSQGTGDLTQRLPVRSQDELGLLAQYMNAFIEKIHQMVCMVRDSSNTVTNTSELLAANAEETAQSTQQVASAIEGVAKGNATQTKSLATTKEIFSQLIEAIAQIATGAQSQAENVNKTSLSIGQVAKSIQDVARSTAALSDTATETNNAALTGGEAVSSAIAGMERIKQTVFESARRIKELGEESKHIGEIIQVIDDIAEQTNLLALNAAIEAARAGEHGKGFAVVADEVRKLAERSSQATKEIADLISHIQRGTANSVKAMEVGTNEVEEGSRLAEDAGQALHAILANVQKTNDQIQKISVATENMSAQSNDVLNAIDAVAAITEENTAATEQMAASSEQVNEHIKDISRVAEDTSASAEEVASSTEQVTGATEEIAQMAQDLTSSANQLKQLISQFKI